MKQYIRHISAQLQAAYPPDEAEELAWWIAEETTGLSRTQLLCGCKGTTIFPNTQEIIVRLLRFEPVQYVFGHTLWSGLDLKVTPATLIPRPETAELVARINAAAPFLQLPLQEGRVTVCDIGTGSGCIAIALKKRHPEWEVTGIDISEEAIEVAKENALRNGAEVRFIVADILKDPLPWDQPVHIFVSNPPYIRESERAAMRANVTEYEPERALFVPDDDPLLFYRRIASLCSSAPSLSFLFFEINEALGRQVAELMAEAGYTDIQISKDSYGKERFIQGRFGQ